MLFLRHIRNDLLYHHFLPSALLWRDHNQFLSLSANGHIRFTEMAEKREDRRQHCIDCDIGKEENHHGHIKSVSHDVRLLFHLKLLPYRKHLPFSIVHHVLRNGQLLPGPDICIILIFLYRS